MKLVNSSQIISRMWRNHANLRRKQEDYHT